MARFAPHARILSLHGRITTLQDLIWSSTAESGFPRPVAARSVVTPRSLFLRSGKWGGSSLLRARPACEPAAVRLLGTDRDRGVVFLEDRTSVSVAIKELILSRTALHT